MKQRRFVKYIVRVLVFILIFASFFSIGNVEAAQITSRKLTLSSSAGGATGVTYSFSFVLPSATVLQSAQAQICTTASGSCTTPTGFVNSSSTLPSQPVNLGDASGWTVNTGTAGSLRLKKTGNVAAPAATTTVTFGTVTNPTAANTTFYARITTYSDDAWTTSVDSGTVAVSTSQSISLTGTVDESLTFCVGTSITGTDCGTISGSSINFGTFSPTSTSSGTSVMAAGTNAASGYVITVNGATLTSGGNTIDALAAQTTSSTGSEQFGLNLRDNATPNVGTNPSGSGTGTYHTNYGTVDQFRFVTGDTVATASVGTLMNAFTVSYIVNITTATEAGTYTATMNYICTATF